MRKSVVAKRLLSAVWAMILLIGLSAFAHEVHEYAVPAQASTAAALKAINGRYLQEIKPLFQAACFDCHSSVTRYPWYHAIPGMRQLIDSDIREAKTHIDMTDDFPFAGHHSPMESLESIRATMQKNTMPPLRYRLMHGAARLSEAEKMKIFQWVEQGLRDLRATP